MVKYQLVLGLTAMSAVKWGLLILGAGLSVFGAVGKYMSGPNWKKMAKNGNGSSPGDMDQTNLSRLEKGSQKPQAGGDNATRSIMFYKEKFKKTDTSMQTEPFFQPVRNGKVLEVDRRTQGNIPERSKQERKIIPVFTDEVDPDPQSQPFEENKHNLKSRLNSPENVMNDQRFPLLNVIDDADRSDKRLNSNKSGYASGRHFQDEVVETSNKLREASVQAVITSPELIRTYNEAQSLKLKNEIGNLKARLDVLERLKSETPKVPSIKSYDARPEETFRMDEWKTQDKNRENRQVKIGNQQTTQSGLPLHVEKTREIMNRNLKLEEEARKLRVELNVLRGLKNGQFPSKSKNRDDWVQTDEYQSTSSDLEKTTLSENISTKNCYKNTDGIILHEQVVSLQKPLVRLQYKNDNDIGNERVNTTVDIVKRFSDDGNNRIKQGYYLNSREKFFGRRKLLEDDTDRENASDMNSIRFQDVKNKNDLELISSSNNVVPSDERFESSRVTQDHGAQNVVDITRRDYNSLSYNVGSNDGNVTGKVMQNLFKAQDSLDVSRSRRFENEVLKALRGEVRAQQSDSPNSLLKVDVVTSSPIYIIDHQSDDAEKNIIGEGTGDQESELLRSRYYDQINTKGSRRRIQASSSTEDSIDHVPTTETTLDEDSNVEELDNGDRKITPPSDKEENDQLSDLKKVKIKKNWKKVLTIVHTSRQIYNYRQLEKRQLFGESIEDFRDDSLEDVAAGRGVAPVPEAKPVRRVLTRTNSVDTDSMEDYDSATKSFENTPSLSRKPPSLKYMERVPSIESLLDSEGMSDATITVTGAFSGGILRRRLSRESSLSDNENL